uniref:VHS domain-containing protein n=1 Tax=Petromyzon marinus TaxID=7757 RepID=S4R8K8_PETMA
PRDALRALKRRLGGGANKNTREVMLALTEPGTRVLCQVLESCMKNCGHRFHVLAASRDFVEGSLVRLILPRSCPTPALRARVLRLLQQAWADAFRSSADLTGVAQVYEALKRKGVEFPPPIAQVSAPRSLSMPESRAWRDRNSKLGRDAEPAVRPQDRPPSVVGQHGRAQQRPSATSGRDPRSETPTCVSKKRSTWRMVPDNANTELLLQSHCLHTRATPCMWHVKSALAARCGTFRRRVHELVSEGMEQQEMEQLLALNDELNRALLQHERFAR